MRYLSLILLLAACAGTGRNPTDKSGSTEKGYYVDDDGDSYTELGGDCDDADPNIHPGAVELCDGGVDNDCDGAADDADTYHVDNIWAMDSDGDGFNDSNGVAMACDIDTLEEFVAANGGELSDAYEQLTDDDYYDEDGDGDPSEFHWDCDDDNAWIYPGAPEVCDGQPNDCDTWDTWVDTDEEGLYTTIYIDADGDTYGSNASTILACEAFPGWSANADDCNDDDGTIYPGAPESCNGVDDNCDESVDEGVMSPFYADVDADGQGNASSSTEGCEAPGGFVDNTLDCNDYDAATYTGAPETCATDGVDNDCDGDIHDRAVDEVTRYYDGDEDGYGDPSDTFTSCTAPSDYVDNDDDCDDTDDTIHPGAADKGSDGLDNDCDGSVDEDPCEFLVELNSNNGQPDSFVAEVTGGGSALSGEWSPEGVVGVTVSSSFLGGTSWYFAFTMDLCLGGSDSATVDAYFPDGTSLADDASASIHSSTDGVPNSVTLVDPDGDGDYSRMITAP